MENSNDDDLTNIYEQQLWRNINNIFRYGNNNLFQNEEDLVARAIEESLLTSAPVFKERISEKGLREIKHEKYNSEYHLNDSCPITLVDFSNNITEIRSLPCKHCFTPKALQIWLEEKPECPICRYKMDSIEERVRPASASEAAAVAAHASEAEAVAAHASEAAAAHAASEAEAVAAHEAEAAHATPAHAEDEVYTLDNYPTSSQFLNRLLYLNEHQDDIYTSRTTFLRNLNNLN